MGLGLSYALTVTRTLSYGIRTSTALENEFNSVERVQEFIGLDQEEEAKEDVREGCWVSLLIVIGCLAAGVWSGFAAACFACWETICTVPLVDGVCACFCCLARGRRRVTS